jgi:hypothetical protein
MKTQETSRVVFTYWLQTHVGKITKPAYTFVGYVFVEARPDIAPMSNIITSECQ